MKIQILGPSGSGKSYLGRKLSSITGIPVTDLDDLFWNNTLSDYEHRRSPQERDLLLQSILLNDHWIIEGVYYKWLSIPLHTADYVFYMDTVYALQVIRIIRRFFYRKIGLTRLKKNETLNGLSSLLKWNHSYNDELRCFVDRLSLERRVEFLRSKGDIRKLIRFWPNYT